MFTYYKKYKPIRNRYGFYVVCWEQTLIIHGFDILVYDVLRFNLEIITSSITPEKANKAGKSL